MRIADNLASQDVMNKTFRKISDTDFRHFRNFCLQLLDIAIGICQMIIKK